MSVMTAWNAYRNALTGELELVHASVIARPEQQLFAVLFEALKGADEAPWSGAEIGSWGNTATGQSAEEVCAKLLTSAGLTAWSTRAQPQAA